MSVKSDLRQLSKLRLGKLAYESQSKIILLYILLIFFIDEPMNLLVNSCNESSDHDLTRDFLGNVAC